MPDATLICNSYSSITNDDEAKIMIIRPPILAARLVGVTKIFDGQSVLDAVDLEIKSGEILVTPTKRAANIGGLIIIILASSSLVIEE